MKRFILILCVALSAAGCATRRPASEWARSEVYFGMSRPDGSLVSATEWQEFMNQEVTPRFPAGLTVLESSGQWRNLRGGIDREPSKVLILVHARDRATEAQVDSIRKAYCARFEQEAVMKVTSPAQVVFAP